MNEAVAVAVITPEMQAALALVAIDKASLPLAIASEYGLTGKKPSEVRSFLRKGYFPDVATGKKLTEAVGEICGSYQKQALVHAVREVVKAGKAGEMLSVAYSKTGLLEVKAHRYAPRVQDPVESVFRKVKAIAGKSEADKGRLIDLVASL